MDLRNSVVRVATAGTAFLLLAGTAQANVINWTDWTASDLLSATGIAGGVGVNFTGTLQFAQLAPGVQVGTGANANTNYWTEGSPAPYTGTAVVDNAPTANELRELQGPR